jgi:hypothetical protein
MLPVVVFAPLALLFGVACSSSTPTSASTTPDAAADVANGPAACVAAGGQCLLGSATCAHVGTADCNPGLNPGGAFCCLDKTGADAAPDNGTCSALGDAGFTSLDDLPIALLCAQSPGRLVRSATTCGGYVLAELGEGTDCESWWAFDPATRALQAYGHGCNGIEGLCSAVPTFTYPQACFPYFPGGWTALCPDAGVDAASDTALDSGVDAADGGG